MRDKATEPAARPANTVVLRRIDAHGSSLEDLVIQLVATNATTVGMAIMPLMRGLNCAAAISGIRKSPFLKTSEVQSSGAVSPVNTERTAITAMSAPSTSSVARSLVRTAAGSTARSAQPLQQPTVTT